jgi:tRNA nucleotidyltransferase (CCA-adding enzyme)
MVAAGFLPVGKDFPVFLHPYTHEEYALARTERKTAAGYHGFAFYTACDVTLDEDLARRDLSINAMALPAALVESGEWLKLAPSALAQHVIDPHGGQADLRAGVLRHVAPAFAEDPVRILRLARFAARFPQFKVHPSTQQLMQNMVAAGEVDALVPERVWQEISRGLMSAQPERMMAVLRECGALAVLMPELNALWGVPQRADYHPEIDTGVHTMMVLQMAARLQTPLPVRFAALTHDLGKGTTPADILPRHIGHEMRSADLLRQVCQRWRVPADCKELAILVAKEHGNIHRSLDLNPSALLRLLERCDALRRPERFALALLACECDARGRLGHEENAYPQAGHLQKALAAAQSVDAGAVLAKAKLAQSAAKPSGDWAALQMRQAREAAIAAMPKP